MKPPNKEIRMCASAILMAVLLPVWTVQEIETVVIEVAIGVLFFEHIWHVLFGKPKHPEPSN